MCNSACIEFGRTHLGEKEITGIKVIEVGSLDVNGSLRPYVESLNPASYLGIDLVAGGGVDYLCPQELMVEELGEERYGIVICTEVLEHVRDWRLVIKNLKLVCAIGGTILLTTRSKGFPKHEYPNDYWRFEVEDMKHIFSDCIDVVVEKDPEMPGVFVKAIMTHKILNLQLYGVAGV